MPMMIVTDDEFEAELDNCAPQLNKSDKARGEIKDDAPKGRGEGNKEIPPALKEIIAMSVVEGARSQHVADAFNVSKSTVDAAKHGAQSTSSYNTPHDPLANKVNNKKNQIIDESQQKILEMLAAMTEDKVNSASLKVLSAAARDISSVYRNVDTNGSADGGTKAPVFIIHAPQARREDSYEVIEARE